MQSEKALFPDAVFSKAFSSRTDPDGFITLYKGEIGF